MNPQKGTNNFFSIKNLKNPDARIIAINNISDGDLRNKLLEDKYSNHWFYKEAIRMLSIKV